MAKKTEQKTGGKKHPGGRPRKYSTPEKMQTVIDKYFEDNPKPTICGLALALGFAQRKSLINYEGYGEEFCNTIKRAKTRVEMYYEGHLVESNAAGSIFALKNFGWRDKQEFDLRIAFFSRNPKIFYSMSVFEAKKRGRPPQKLRSFPIDNFAKM